MNTHKVVMKNVNSNSGLKARKASGKGVRKSSKTAHLHTHGKVVPFDKASRNILPNGVSGNGSEIDTDTIGRRIAVLALRNVFGR